MFLPSFEVSSLFALFWKGGEKKKTNHKTKNPTPNPNHIAFKRDTTHKDCCFTFPRTNNYQHKSSAIDSKHSKPIPLSHSSVRKQL